MAIAYVTNTSAPPFDNDLAGDISNSGVTHNYIPTLYAKKVLYNFYKDTIFKEITNTEYEGQFKSGGTSIVVRMAPDITTRDYTKGAALTYETPAKASITMDIDKAFYQAVQIDDVDKLQTDVELMNMYAEAAKKSMMEDIDEKVLEIMADGAKATTNQGTTAGAISANIDLGADSLTTYVGIDRSNALDKIVEIGQVLGEQNLSSYEKFVVIPEWYASRLKLSDLKAADFTGDTTGVIRTGLIGQINGTKIYVNNSIHKGTTNTGAYGIVGGIKEATAFAMQLSKIETLKVPTSFGEYWRSLYVWGSKVMRPEGVATLWAMPA